MYVYYHFTSHLLSWASHIIIPSPSERKINCFWFGWIWIEQKWWNRSEATRNAGDRGWKRTRKEWRSSILASLLLLSRPPPLLSPLRYTFITPLLLSFSLSLSLVFYFSFCSDRQSRWSGQEYHLTSLLSRSEDRVELPTSPLPITRKSVLSSLCFYLKFPSILF